jgi:hypothetical protein
MKKRIQEIRDELIKKVPDEAVKNQINQIFNDFTNKRIDHTSINQFYDKFRKIPLEKYDSDLQHSKFIHSISGIYQKSTENIDFIYKYEKRLDRYQNLKLAHKSIEHLPFSKILPRIESEMRKLEKNHPEEAKRIQDKITALRQKPPERPFYWEKDRFLPSKLSSPELKEKWMNYLHDNLKNGRLKSHILEDEYLNVSKRTIKRRFKELTDEYPEKMKAILKKAEKNYNIDIKNHATPWKKEIDAEYLTKLVDKMEKTGFSYRFLIRDKNSFNISECQFRAKRWELEEKFPKLMDKLHNIEDKNMERIKEARKQIDWDPKKEFVQKILKSVENGNKFLQMHFNPEYQEIHESYLRFKFNSWKKDSNPEKREIATKILELNKKNYEHIMNQKNFNISNPKGEFWKEVKDLANQGQTRQEIISKTGIKYAGFLDRFNKMKKIDADFAQQLKIQLKGNYDAFQRRVEIQKSSKTEKSSEVEKTSNNSKVQRKKREKSKPSEKLSVESNSLKSKRKKQLKVEQRPPNKENALQPQTGIKELLSPVTRKIAEKYQTSCKHQPSSEHKGNRNREGNKTENPNSDEIKTHLSPETKRIASQISQNNKNEKTPSKERTLQDTTSDTSLSKELSKPNRHEYPTSIKEDPTPQEKIHNLKTQIALLENKLFLLDRSRDWGGHGTPLPYTEGQRIQAELIQSQIKKLQTQLNILRNQELDKTELETRPPSIDESKPVQKEQIPTSIESKENFSP